MSEQVPSKELVTRLRDPKFTGQEMMREEAARAIEHWHGEFEIIQALFGGDNWRELTASQIHDRVSDLMLQLTQLQMKLKRYEPTDTYNGLTIEQWKARAEAAEARLAHEPAPALPPKLDTTMPTVWHYLLVAAHHVVEAVDFNHDNKAEPLKWTVPWAKVTALRDAVLKAKALNGASGPTPPPDSAPIAPIAKLIVSEDDVVRAVMYAPGLPPGEHDLYPEGWLPDDHRDQTITSLCDRIERIFCIAIDQKLTHVERIKQIQEWSAGFMQPPCSTATKGNSL